MSITIATLLIKFLGMIKQSVIATFCGATFETDAFFVATGIIGQLSIVFFSAISISLLSMYSREKYENGVNSANQLIDSSLCVFLPISIIMALIFYIFSEKIALLIAPKYSIEQIVILVHYIRIMSFAFIPWCYYLSVNVVLESNHIFLPGKGQGFFQNILLIFAAIFLYDKYQTDILVYFFLLSGIFQSVYITLCAKKYYFPQLNIKKIKTVVQQLLPLSIPLIIGNAIYGVNDIIDKLIAVSLGEGMASLLTYGATLNEIVTGLFVASISKVLFANFTIWSANKESKKIVKSVQLAIEYLSVFIIPIFIIYIISGDQLVSILYGRGNFGIKEINDTYLIVIGYSLGFVFQSIRSILLVVFYAYQDNKTPMVNGAIAVLINIALSFYLSKKIGVMGIAIATSIGIGVVTVLFMISARKYLSGLKIKEIIIEFMKSILAGLIIALPVYIIKVILDVNILVKFIIEVFISFGGIFIILVLLRSTSILRIMKYITEKCKVKGK